MARFILFISIIFINFTIFSISNVEITIGYICIIISPLVFFNKIKLSKKIIYLYFIILIFDLLKLWLIEGWSFEMTKSITTHIQIFLLFIYFSVYLRSDMKLTFLKYFKSTLHLVGYVIVFSILLQFISFYLFDNILYNYFGKFQWMYQLHLEAFRPKSFFLEPSYLSLVLNVLLLVDFIIAESDKLLTKYRVFIVIGIFSSLSFFGIIVCLVIILTYYYLCGKTNYKHLSYIIVVLILLLSLNTFSRLSEINTENTSGYERILIPILSLYYMFNDLNLFFGIPFGYDYLLLDKVENIYFFRISTIQNSFLLLIIYLGFLTIPILILYIRQFIKESKEIKLLLIVIPLLMFNSGGLYVFYYSYLIYLIPILAIRFKNENRKIKNSTY